MPTLLNVILVAIVSLHSAVLSAQSLTISNTGQTGTSGTNWSTAGTDPVTISVTGSANINTSVIQDYLDAGTSVIVTNSTVGTTINSNINKTNGGNARLTVKDVGCIKIAANVTIGSGSNTLDLVFWADSDNSQGGIVDDFIYTAEGVTLSSNGGMIVMAGGPDDGTNGGTSGDGIPDGFAWNSSNSALYGANTVGGLTLGPLSGTGTVVSLLSSNGEIILRGSSGGNNLYPGISSQANLKIVSGTGKITLYGKSTVRHGVELTYGAAPAVAISSASVSIPAIDLKGTSTASGYAGFWISNNASGSTLIESSSATGGGLSIEGVSSTNNGIQFGISNTNIITQLLSQSGSITLRGDGAGNASLFLYGDVYVGNRKDATAVQGVTPSVTASTANILLQADDQYNFSNTAGKNTNFNTTGSLTAEAYTGGYSGTISWTGNVAFGSSFSSITLGESAENYSVTANTSLSSTGSITAYASDFTLGNGIGLSSSGAGNISILAKGSFITSGSTRRTISSVNGNITIHADADASGNGGLDIDYLTFNPGSGNITLRAETLSWTTTLATDKPYLNGTGAVLIEPSDAGFQAISTSMFYFDQDGDGISGITIGKSGNTNTITNNQALAVAGAVYFYGTDITISGTINTSTGAANGDVYLKGSGSIYQSTGNTITTSGGDLVMWADADGTGGGRVEMLANISTGGGHIWVGGGSGSETQNGLSVPTGYAQSVTIDKQGVLIKGNTINSAGGTIRIKGESNDAGDGARDVGVMLVNTTVQSGAGDLSLYGTVKNDLNTGAGLWLGTEVTSVIATGNVTVSSSSGNIYLEGISAAGNTFNWAHGLAIIAYNGDDISISSSTGNISSFGDGSISAGFAGEAVGWVIQNSAINSYTSITTDGGAISISGTSANSGDDVSLALRANNTANNIVIGDANSGDVTLKFGTLQTTSQVTTGVTSIGGAGALVLEPYNADWAANFILPDEYAVGSAVSLFRIGKSTNTKTVTLDLSATVTGAVSIYGSTATLNQNLASTAAGNISLFTNSLNIAAGKTISSAGTLIIEPQTNGTTIGLTGGTGTLAVGTDYFNNNFSNGFNEIRIGNTGAGTITVGTALGLQDPLQLITAGNLVLNETITAGANDLTFSGTAIAPAIGKYIRTNGTGKLKITVANGAGTLFPVGTANYTPITLTNNTGTSGEFYVTVSDGVYHNGAPTGSLSLAAPRVDLTWNIGNSGASTGAGTVDLDFTWNPASVAGTFVAPKLLHYNGSAWDILPGTPTYNLPAGTLSYSGYSGSFSPFAIGESNFILPVTWLSFTGTTQGKTVILNWATALESNNDYYEIERSANGIQYGKIGQVEAGQNPAVRNEYRFTDNNPLIGEAFYRLKQVDRDGHARYSTVISVIYAGETGISIRVIPGSGQLGLTVPAAVTGPVDLLITDNIGRQLQRQTVRAGQQIITLKAATANTVYFIKLLKEGKPLYTGRFIL